MSDGIPKIAEGVASREIARRMVATDPQLAEQHRVSTDPDWPSPGMAAATYVDGRHRRHAKTHQLILNTCRDLMTVGNFRPSGQQVAEMSGAAVRTVFDHFDNVEALHLEAIENAETRYAIADRVFGPERHAMALDVLDKMARAIVLGRVG